MIEMSRLTLTNSYFLKQPGRKCIIMFNSKIKHISTFTMWREKQESNGCVGLRKPLINWLIRKDWIWNNKGLMSLALPCSTVMRHQDKKRSRWSDAHIMASAYSTSLWGAVLGLGLLELVRYYVPKKWGQLITWI